MPWPVLLAFFAGIASLLVLARLLSAISNRHYQRLANRQCVNCGYDLRESTERCPECGAYFGLGWGGILEE
jgi:rubrerythrin